MLDQLGEEQRGDVGNDHADGAAAAPPEITTEHIRLVVERLDRLLDPGDELRRHARLAIDHPRDGAQRDPRFGGEDDEDAEAN